MAVGSSLRGLRIFRHPAQYVVFGFATATLVGAGLLMLPMASHDDTSTSFVDAWFTATSAVCVTGLTVLDTGGHWTGFGQAVVLGLIQVGGLGIMTLTALIVVGLARRLGLRQRMIAAASTGSLQLGEVRSILRGVALVTVVVEATVAVLLTLRFWLAYDRSFGGALWDGVFHAVSAFNNAGFGLRSDNLISYQDDAVVLLLVAGAVILGGLGFPVWVQIARTPRRPHLWDLHAKLTITATVGLIAAGWAALALSEWTNPATLGSMDTAGSLLNSFFASVTPRTAGFNAIDVASMREEGRVITEMLMFIGGGSGSTAGGIKVTTFAVLAFVIWSEVRGDPDVSLFNRRIPTQAQRQALTVALLAVVIAATSVLLLLRITTLPLDALLFETVSALGTVGLSVGITPLLPDPAKVVLVTLMLLGRVGPPTLFAALVSRESERLYRHPEERPIIG
ncbi:MAG: TrkH family potassium uptake protein [Acidimicrobiia bacterium]|jgi:trk system potassium uptake protein